MGISNIHFMRYLIQKTTGTLSGRRYGTGGAQAEFRRRGNCRDYSGARDREPPTEFQKRILRVYDETGPDYLEIATKMGRDPLGIKMEINKLCDRLLITPGTLSLSEAYEICKTTGWL